MTYEFDPHDGALRRKAEDLLIAHGGFLGIFRSIQHPGERYSFQLGFVGGPLINHRINSHNLGRMVALILQEKAE